MFRNNPFLIRELRQLDRRRPAVQGWTAVAVGVLSLPVLWPVFFVLVGGERNFKGGTLALQMFHAFLCFGTGWYWGWRVYASERAGHTLEAVLMLPYRPVEWLAQKLALPLLCCGTAVALALPVYLSAIFLGVERMGHLPRAMGQAAAAALLGLCFPLMSPPVLEGPSDLAAQTPAARRQHQQREATKGLLLILAIGVLVLASAGRVLGLRTFHMLFGLRVPLWTLWGGVLGLTLGAVVLTAASPLGSEAWAHRAARFRLGCCLLFFHLGVGLAAQRLPLPATAALLLLPWAMWALADRFITLPRDDPWSEGDLRRIAAHSQNPLLHLDYRVQSRRASWLRAFGGGLVVSLLLILVFRWLNGSWAGTIRMMFSGGAFAIWMNLFSGVGGHAAAMWQREVTANAVAPLLLTPLSSREMVKGRLGAACLRALGYTSGLMLPLIALPFVVATPQSVKLLPALLGAIPLLVTTNLCSAFSFGDKGFPRPPMAPGEQVSYWTLWVLHGVGLVCCFLAGGLGWVGKPGALVLACVPATVGFLLHTAAARWMYQLKIRRLEAIRQTDFTGTE